MTGQGSVPPTRKPAGTPSALELGPFGITIEFLRTGEDTGGELLEMEIAGRPRGFFTQRHVHPSQAESITALAGQTKVTMHGRDHILDEGESIEIPAGTPHIQAPIGQAPGRVRIQVRPAGQTKPFLEHLGKLCREGRVMRAGFPQPVAAAEVVLRFADAGHASAPSLEVQRAFARFVLSVARLSRPYEFVDEWEVAAPPAATFEAVADTRTYPAWWRPVYIEVETDGPPRLGCVSRQHFKGRLPYHLHTSSVITAFEPPRMVTADVDGDLLGRGVWTLTPTAVGTHVRFDWRVHADRLLLRAFTPLLRPVFRWNHNWAIARAMDGLERYAQGIGDSSGA